MFSMLWTPNGRRAAAFMALLGGCVCMTAFAAVGVYLARGNANHTFYLALAAHAQLLVGLTALSALLVKRNLSVGKDGVKIEDEGPTQ